MAEQGKDCGNNKEQRGAPLAERTADGRVGQTWQLSTWQCDVASTAYATGKILRMLLCAIACAPALPPAWHSYSPEHYHTYGELELSQPSACREI